MFYLSKVFVYAPGVITVHIKLSESFPALHTMNLEAYGPHAVYRESLPVHNLLRSMSGVDVGVKTILPALRVRGSQVIAQMTDYGIFRQLR